MPNGGVLTTRNSDHTFYNETFASGDVIYVAIGDGLDSIELPSGASAEIAKTATRNSGGSSAVGGVTSWNDLTDKPFGDETAYILPVTNLTFTYMADMDISMTQFESQADFVTNAPCTVNYNGVEYEGTLSYTNGCYLSGNMAIMGMGDDTGEPFMLFVEDATPMLLVSGNVTNVTVSISTIKKNPMDSDYAPDTTLIDLVTLGLPSVTYGSGVEVAFTDIELLKQVFKKGVVRLRFSMTGDIGNSNVEDYTIETATSNIIFYESSSTFVMRVLVDKAFFEFNFNMGSDLLKASFIRITTE